jgi:hypothetical protein
LGTRLVRCVPGTVGDISLLFNLAGSLDLLILLFS